jgi:hypothetical protein
MTQKVPRRRGNWGKKKNVMPSGSLKAIDV